MTADTRPRADGPPPAKRRKVAAKKERSTEYVDLEHPTEQGEAELDRLMRVLRKKKKIVVIAGAGISVAAGSKYHMRPSLFSSTSTMLTAASVPDFRSSTGLFKTLPGEHKMKGSGKQLFDASVYKHDSSTSSFHEMVRRMSEQISEAKPTHFHHLLASLAHEGRLLRLYTQNIDCIDTNMPPLATTVPLNNKGPWPKTIQLHGGLDKMVCSKCGELETFNPSLFEGPEPPPCQACLAMENARVLFGERRSHGVGKLRPRIVLYNEHHPDQDAIGNVSAADLKRVPDAVLVVGTTLKVPGVRRIVKEMCQVTRSRRDGFTAWINLEPKPQGPLLKDCWDLVVKGKCDDVAKLAGLTHWDEQELGDPVAYILTDEEHAERLRKSRVEVELESRSTATPEAEEIASEHQTPATLRSKTVQQIQEGGGMPTPSASPRHRSPMPAKTAASGKTKQTKLDFGNAADNVSKKELTPTSSRASTPRAAPAKTAAKTAAKGRKPLKSARGQKHVPAPKANSLTASFKTTKAAATSTAGKMKAGEDDRSLKENMNMLPNLRPMQEERTTVAHKILKHEEGVSSPFPEKQA
jgi:NAD-dependent histone deacetylase SIR2